MDKVSPCPSKDNNSGDISLHDVQNESPAESEEETRVMEDLESSDLSAPDKQQEELAKDARLALLLHQEEDDDDGERFVRRHRRTATVEQELFAATTTINRLHYEDIESSALVPPPAEIFFGTKKQTEETEDDEPELSNYDNFAANAGKIFHRFEQKQRQQKSTGSNNTDIETGASPQDDERKDDSKKKQRIHENHPNLEALKDFREILLSNKKTAYRYTRNQIFFIILPSTALACFFFYVLEQPPQMEDTTRSTSFGTSFLSSGLEDENPSMSWFILFLGVRQVITYGLARGLQFVTLACSTRMSYGLIGPLLRLFLLQAKGWPLQLMLWSIIDFTILQGPSRFAHHWLFYQSFFGVFNETNPAGHLTSSKYYRNLLLFGLFSGLAIALKRFVLGLRFGKMSYYRYSKKLSYVLKKVLLVNKVARRAHTRGQSYNTEGEDIAVLDKWFHSRKESNDTNVMAAIMNDSDLQQWDKRTPLSRQTTIASHNALTKSQKIKIDELLGEWEDTDIIDDEVENPSLSAIVQFRSSTSVLSSDYVFSHAFGRAKTRAEVVDGAQELYRALLLKQEEVDGNDVGAVLRFHTIAITALREDESFDHDMAKDLVRLFRPARDGDIRLLEFCKSIDTLYKAMRKLRASIANEGRMNAASEKFLNAVFYSLLAVIGLAVLGVDTTTLIGVLASFILSASFMIGGAAADYFRGLLLILVQRPYDIGDRISIASPESDASVSGSSGWIVKDVTLYHTTLIYGATQEYATISNGYLAKSRIINAARSPRAALHFLMKFGIHVSDDTVEKFKEAIVEYVKSKPREWLSFTAFRMTRFEADLGYVEYKIILEHRDSWQHIGGLLASLADVQSHAFTMSKELNMGYKSPSLPVDLHLPRGEGSAAKGNGPISQLLARPP